MTRARENESSVRRDKERAITKHTHSKQKKERESEGMRVREKAEKREGGTERGERSQNRVGKVRTEGPGAVFGPARLLILVLMFTKNN